MQIHEQYHRAEKHCTTNDGPIRQVGIYNCIENTQEKRPACRCDTGSSFEPRFCHGERARQPRNQLDDDGVDKRGNVQRPQKGAATCYRPAQQHPAAPKQMHGQDGFRKDGYRANGTGTSLVWLGQLFRVIRHIMMDASHSGGRPCLTLPSSPPMQLFLASYLVFALGKFPE